MAGFSSLLDSFLDVASVLDQLLWGPWTVLFIASVSIYLTVRTGFFQVRKLRLILKSTLLQVLAPANPAVVVPISPARYEVAFTASAELHDKYAAFALRTDSLGIRAIYGLPRLSS